MSIKISKTTKDSIKDFDDKEWEKADRVHYGNNLWKSEKYYFKAVSDGNIVGTVSGDFESGTVYVKKLLSAEKMRSQGVGRLLLEKVEEYAKKMNAHKVWLQTGDDWKVNEFYNKMGYKITANHPKHYFKKNFVVYTKFL